MSEADGDIKVENKSGRDRYYVFGAGKWRPINKGEALEAIKGGARLIGGVVPTVAVKRPAAAKKVAVKKQVTVAQPVVIAAAPAPATTASSKKSSLVRTDNSNKTEVISLTDEMTWCMKSSIEELEEYIRRSGNSRLSEAMQQSSLWKRCVSENMVKEYLADNSVIFWTKTGFEYRHGPKSSVKVGLVVREDRMFIDILVQGREFANVESRSDLKNVLPFIIRWSVHYYLREWTRIQMHLIPDVIEVRIEKASNSEMCRVPSDPGCKSTTNKLKFKVSRSMYENEMRKKAQLQSNFDTTSITSHQVMVVAFDQLLLKIEEVGAIPQYADLTAAVARI